MLVRKAKVIPIEAIVRGYITGMYLVIQLEDGFLTAGGLNHLLVDAYIKALAGQSTRNRAPYTALSFLQVFANRTSSPNRSSLPRQRLMLASTMRISIHLKVHSLLYIIHILWTSADHITAFPFPIAAYQPQN